MCIFAFQQARQSLLQVHHQIGISQANKIKQFMGDGILDEMTEACEPYE